MTKTCIVCKKFSTPGDIRSFHKFPVDNKLRQKWISAIGISTLPKTATVCSDHFHEKNLHTSANSSVRRLLSDAVPLMSFDEEQLETLMDVTQSINNKYCKELIEPLTPLEIYCPLQLSIDVNVLDVTLSATDGESIYSPNPTNNTDENINIRKRKIDKSDRTAPKKIKFMDGVKTKYISREDFVSDEAWDRFIRFKVCKDLKQEAI